MLKIKIALLATFSLLLFSCNTKSKEEKATKIKTEEHQHSESETIQLNNGEKWKVDDNMMLHIRNMEKDIIHFDQEKSKALEIQSKIERTDKEIDQMVYELYGLVDEEILIVENS